MSHNLLSENKHYIEVRDAGNDLDTTYAILGFDLSNYPLPDDIAYAAGHLDARYPWEWGTADLVDELERMGYDDIDVIITQETAYI